MQATTRAARLRYLADCYRRTEETFGKKYSEVPPVSTLLPEAQAQLSQHSLLVLQNCYEEAEEGPGPLGARSPVPAALQGWTPFSAVARSHGTDVIFL